MTRSSAPSASGLNGTSRLETYIATVLTLLSILLMVASAFHAGAFWRDEVNSIVIARADWGNLWDRAKLDSMPMVSLLLIKSWRTLTPFLNDQTSLRGLGLCTGLGLVAAIWWTTRVVGKRPPTLAMAFLALCPVVIRYSETLRPYGLASVGAVLALGAFWRALQSDKPGDLWLAFLLALLCAHTLFTSVFLVVGISMASAAVAWSTQRRRQALLLILAGWSPLPTLLIYRDMFAFMRHISPVVKFDDNTTQELIASVLALAGQAPLWLTLSLSALALATVVLALSQIRQQPVRELTAFVLGAGLLGCAGTAAFFIATNNFVTSWYTVPSLTLLAVAVGALAGQGPPRFQAHAWVLSGAFLVVAVAAFRPTYRESCLRQSNMDIVAGYLRENARPDDLIIVYPWYYGVSLAFYDHGSAPLESIPPLSEHTLHRFDMYMDQVMARAPMDPLLKRVDATLAGGHRIWLVGDTPPLVQDWQHVQWSPVDNLPWPLRRNRADAIWCSQLIRELDKRSARTRVVDVPRDARPEESAGLLVSQVS